MTRLLRELTSWTAGYILGLPKWSVIAIGYLFAFCLELLNYLTGHEVRLAPFYFPVLFLLTWFVSVRSAILLAAISSIAWFLIGYDFYSLTSAGHAWDAIVRFVIFSVFIYVVRAYKRERVFARQDFLTKIANNQYFTELAVLEIERCRRYGHPFSVVYMDVDNFKTINDTLGHRTGDNLLYEVAQTIRKHIRGIDTVARLGGDEFAILLPETDDVQASAMIPKINEILMETMQAHSWPCSFSFGVATFLSAPASFDDMLRRADRLMYEAKSRGKNRVSSGIYR